MFPPRPAFLLALVCALAFAAHAEAQSSPWGHLAVRLPLVSFTASSVPRDDRALGQRTLGWGPLGAEGSFGGGLVIKERGLLGVDFQVGGMRTEGTNGSTSRIALDALVRGEIFAGVGTPLRPHMGPVVGFGIRRLSFASDSGGGSDVESRGLLVGAVVGLHLFQGSVSLDPQLSVLYEAGRRDLEPEANAFHAVRASLQLGISLWRSKPSSPSARAQRLRTDPARAEVAPGSQVEEAASEDSTLEEPPEAVASERPSIVPDAVWLERIGARVFNCVPHAEVLHIRAVLSPAGVLTNVHVAEAADEDVRVCLAQLFIDAAFVATGEVRTVQATFERPKKQSPEHPDAPAVPGDADSATKAADSSD